MRIERETFLLQNVAVGMRPEIDQAIDEVRRGIGAVDWPDGKGRFTLHPTPMGNGVKPIKARCMAYLRSAGWLLERKMALAQRERPGPVDAVKLLSDRRYFAVEWETGNISSSHRAMNKMMVGLQQRTLAGGVLIVPTRAMYFYLTDRIGNYEELMPYFSVWNRPDVEGVLLLIAVEHDDTSKDVPLIPKGTDGRALV